MASCCCHSLTTTTLVICILFTEKNSMGKAGKKTSETPKGPIEYIKRNINTSIVSIIFRFTTGFLLITTQNKTIRPPANGSRRTSAGVTSFRFSVTMESGCRSFFFAISFNSVFYKYNNMKDCEENNLQIFRPAKSTTSRTLGLFLRKSLWKR